MAVNEVLTVSLLVGRWDPEEARIAEKDGVVEYFKVSPNFIWKEGGNPRNISDRTAG